MRTTDLGKLYLHIHEKTNKLTLLFTYRLVFCTWRRNASFIRMQHAADIGLVQSLMCSLYKGSFQLDWGQLPTYCEYQSSS